MDEFTNSITIFGLVTAITMTIICVNMVKGYIQKNQAFDGLCWGMLVGATTGILCCFIFYQQAKRELDKLILKQPKEKTKEAREKVIEVKREIRRGLIIGLVIGFVLWSIIWGYYEFFIA